MAEEQKKATGRPSKFTEALFDEIISRISEGEPLRQICRDAHMPTFATVYSWIGKGDELSIRFARARIVGWCAIAEDCLEIADDGRNDWMEVNGKSVQNSEAIQRSKLRVDTRQKMLAIWDPTRYGNKIDLTSSDGSMSPKSGIDAAKLSKENLEAVLAARIKPEQC